MWESQTENGACFELDSADFHNFIHINSEIISKNKGIIYYKLPQSSPPFHKLHLINYSVVFFGHEALIAIILFQ